MEHALNGETGVTGFPWIWLIIGLIIAAYLFHRFGFERTIEPNGKIVRRCLLKGYLPGPFSSSSHRAASRKSIQRSPKKKKQLRHLYELRQVAFGLLLYGLGVFVFGLGFVYAVTENTVARPAWQGLCLIGTASFTTGIYIIVTRHRNNPFRKKMIPLQRDSFLNTRQRRKQIVATDANSAKTYR